MKALVIDDSELARAQVRRLLEAAGFEVFEQPSAIGATRNVVRLGIDVALVDVSMPGLSGDKLVRLLRENPRSAHLIIVVMSARTQEELELAVADAGADAVLPKERVELELVQLLRNLRIARGPSNRNSTRTHHA